MIWMRIAGASRFNKLYGKISENLSPGSYYLKIQNNYDVSKWGGGKSIALSTTNIFGGQNYNVAICYCILSLFSFVLMTISIIYKNHQGK